jgi:hypothetical protein
MSQSTDFDTMEHMEISSDGSSSVPPGVGMNSYTHNGDESDDESSSLKYEAKIHPDDGDADSDNDSSNYIPGERELLRINVAAAEENAEMEAMRAEIFELRKRITQLEGAIERLTSTESSCWGCREHQPNQMAHMDPGGCLCIDDGL